MKEFHKELFQKEFDREDTKLFKTIIDPTKTNTVFNRISRFEDEGVYCF
jgi:hypothetical protein